MLDKTFLTKTSAALLAGTMMLSLPAAPTFAQQNQTQQDQTQQNQTQQDQTQSQTQAGDNADNSAGIQPQSIVETVADRAGFQILSLLIDAAGLKETLQGGEYTIFAPSDEAFGALPSGAVAALLKDENKELLKTILLSHVIEGSKPGGAFIDQSSQVKTMSGESLNVEGKGELVLRIPGAPAIGRMGDQVVAGVQEIEASVPLVSITADNGMIVPAPPAQGLEPVEKAYVTLPDITVTNGVVHAINAVIVPKQAMDALGLSSR